MTSSSLRDDVRPLAQRVADLLAQDGFTCRVLPDLDGDAAHMARRVSAPVLRPVGRDR